jgi:JAB domain-containing protein similar to deubiquitination enzymes
MNVERLLKRAAAGDEQARAAVRSGRYVTVTRMTDSVGQVRSLPEKIKHGPPIAARRTPRRAAAHPASVPVVRFAKWAAKELRDELMATADGRETGGALMGSIGRGGSVVVEHVVGPTDWTERDAHTFRIERDSWLLIERSHDQPGWLWLGDWHSHDELEPRPSQHDFDGWRAAVRRGVGLYVGVIATPDPDVDWRFDAPRFAAWITTRDGKCVRATLAKGD